MKRSAAGDGAVIADQVQCCSAMSGQLTALIAAILWLQATAVPAGNHTCTGVIKHPVNVLVNVTEPVTFRSYTWCLRVPPRCSKYTVQLKDRVKLHVEMHNKTITVCCEGYVEMEGRCVPACPPGADCPFMRCNRTNHCHCTPGYTGLYCNEACPRGLWGKDCKRPCDCPSGYTCHHLTGDCFVDDRPPRRTTTPTTTTTTTTITRPTTTTTTPTTEGTTLETVKTPHFRFPPPPWVESAADSKKTTTRQVKKDESPPTKEMDVIQEILDVTTIKSQLEISLPTLATVLNKTSVERPTSIELFPPLWNEEKVNKKVVDGSTNFKELETVEEVPIKPLLPTIVLSTSTEKDESLINEENVIKKNPTLSKVITTPIPTSPTSEYPNTSQLHTVTIETILPIDFTANNQNHTEHSPIDTMVHTPALFVTRATTKLPDIVTQRPIIATDAVTTQQILYSTKPEQGTIKNDIQKEIFTTPISYHTIESAVLTTTHENISSLEKKSTINPLVFHSNESPSTTITTSKNEEIIKEKEPVLDNQYQTTTPIFINPTKSIHLEEKHFTSTFSDPETSPETIVLKTENTPASSTLNNKFPFILLQGFSLPPLPSTTITSSSSIPNHETTNSYPVSTTPTSSATYNQITSKKSRFSFPPLVNLTTVASTTSNWLTTPLDLTTTHATSTTIKSTITYTTTTESPTITTLNASSPLAFSRTKSPSSFAATMIPVANTTPSTAPTTTTPVTLAVTTTTEPTTVTPLKTDPSTTVTPLKTDPSTTVTPLKTDPSTTATTLMTSTFAVSKEIFAEGNNDDTSKPQIEETVPIPTLATDIIKDFNAHKKLKPDEAYSIYSGQDKPKKKHEKIKPKNVNAKEFPSIYQTKTEKNDENAMQQTTKISLRSILQAETFINKIITTKASRPTKTQPTPDFIDINFVTDERPFIETVSVAPTQSKPNQIWHALKKQNFSSNSGLKVQEALGILKEPSEISESGFVTTEMNRVMESNTIDYRQSSEEPMKKVLAQEEETNYSLIFNKIKFNMTESIAAGVKLSREESSYFHLPMILVLGIALVTLLLLTLTLWVYLKRRRQRAEPFPPCIMAYAMEETQPMDCDSYDQAFFCPTFTNIYAEKINRELRELHYDHPRSSQPEPLYAEIFN
ncbi:unnamed protein product [Nezara viridula]|uniref:EMI domain-containing protein n=1 Tax=Nezara viridula TaxID=85310 RepID=A0A9P0E2E2_NEZVI|nr:unnamed protein product [Nezara viridula]